MAKEPDIFATMTPAQRAQALSAMAFGLLGEQQGKAFIRQMAGAVGSKTRQLGDAPEPEKNYWQGAWRIYELE